MFNGWYGKYEMPTIPLESGTWNAWLEMKWSKDWVPMANEPVGAWVTNHWQWYLTDPTITSADWYGFATATRTDHNSVPVGALYYVTENEKIEAVSDNSAAWATYQANGAYDSAWRDYSDGVPMYLVFQDIVSIYSLNGNLLETVMIAGGLEWVSLSQYFNLISTIFIISPLNYVVCRVLYQTGFISLYMKHTMGRPLGVTLLSIIAFLIGLVEVLRAFLTFSSPLLSFQYGLNVHGILTFPIYLIMGLVWIFVAYSFWKGAEIGWILGLVMACVIAILNIPWGQYLVCW